MEIRFVLLLPNKLNKKCMAISRDLVKKFKYHYVVDGRKLMYHITLFSIGIRKKDLPSVIDLFEEIWKSSKPLELKILGYDNRFESEWFGFRVKKTKELIRFRKNLQFVISRFNQKSARDFKLYAPHITLGMLRNVVDIKFAKTLFHPPNSNFTVSEAAIAGYNRWGQIRRLYKKPRLL